MPVRFRGYNGRYVKAADRFSGNVKTVEAYRRRRWVVLVEDGNFDNRDLAVVLNRKEYESIPAAFEKVDDYTPRSKYQAWNIAEQIDKTRGIRRKLLKVKLVVSVGKKKKTIQFYTKINKNQKSSYRIYQRINEALGAEGYYTYKSINGKTISERRGKKVKIIKVTLEEVI